MTLISDPGYDLAVQPTHLYVFTHLDRQWIAVGRASVGFHREGRPEFSFDYGRNWGSHPKGFSLDPLSLPLNTVINPSHLLFGALVDAGPDRWGTRLVNEQFAIHQAKAGNSRYIPSAFDRLLLTGDDRVGSLAFGLSAQQPLIRPAIIKIKDLSAIEAVMVKFDESGEIDDEGLRLLANGTSLGGARPKATVRGADGQLWLSKFRRKNSDEIDVVRAEYAMMTLASKAGVNVAETAIVNLGSREALLVKRFDRHRSDDGEVRHPYLSAMSLTGHNEAESAGSYMEIADRMRLIGCPATDCVELFRRMIVNIACGNTDDHLKNHGFLFINGGWRLSKAFDIVPDVKGEGVQAISVGRIGVSPTYENTLSECGRFGLNQDEAKHIALEVADVMTNWREHFQACGVTDQDLRLIERHMGRLKIPSVNLSLGM